MFSDSKYTKWYFRIINFAQTKKLYHRPKGYQRHHIIPSSLGGTDEFNNLVMLTPREHFVCHLLLLKMTSGINRSKMAFAMMRFGGGNTSRSFAAAARLISETMSGTGNPMFGKSLTDDHRSKITGEKHGMFGSYCKDLWIDRFGIEEAEKRDTIMRRKRSATLSGSGNPMFGTKQSEERRAQHSATLTGRKYIWKDGKQKRVRPEDFQTYFNDGWSFTKEDQTCHS